jgi:hypothetical protein
MGEEGGERKEIETETCLNKMCVSEETIDTHIRRWAQQKSNVNISRW